MDKEENQVEEIPFAGPDGRRGSSGSRGGRGGRGGTGAFRGWGRGHGGCGKCKIEMGMKVSLYQWE